MSDLEERIEFDSDGKLHGEYIVKWDNGVLDQKTTYNHGVMVGLCESYFDNRETFFKCFHNNKGHEEGIGFEL